MNFENENKDKNKNKIKRIGRLFVFLGFASIISVYYQKIMLEKAGLSTTEINYVPFIVVFIVLVVAGFFMVRKK